MNRSRGSLGVSALVAAIPIFVLFFMLGMLRKPAWMSALTALAIGPRSSRSPSTACRCSWRSSRRVYGAAYGLFPIAWIVFTSIMLYRLAVDTGKFEIIKDSVGGLTDDRRLQAMFIAFSFGAFIEGAAASARRWRCRARCSPASASTRSTPPASACWPIRRPSPSARSAFR